jgi:hypothetical protein
MPEYIMEGRDTAARTESEFVLGFIEAALFTSSEPGRDMAEWFTPEATRARMEGTESSVPGDAGYLEIHPDSLALIRTFCQSWQNANAPLLRRAYGREGYTEAQAGRDLWFTMNGHGVGFWDRPQLDAEGLGADLTDAAGHVECYLFFGGHVEYGDAPFIHFDGLA